MAIVMDDGTGLYVCDAQVTATATDGSATYPGRVELYSDAAISGEWCGYVIYPGTSGKFAISATAPGLRMTGATPLVTFQPGDCGYEGSPLSVKLVLTP